MAGLGGTVNDASRKALIVWFVSKSETFVLGPFPERKEPRPPGRTPAQLHPVPSIHSSALNNWRLLDTVRLDDLFAQAAIP